MAEAHQALLTESDHDEDEPVQHQNTNFLDAMPRGMNDDPEEGAQNESNNNT